MSSSKYTYSADVNNNATIDKMKVLLLKHDAMDADGEHMTITGLTSSEALFLMEKIVICICDTDDEEVKMRLMKVIGYMTNAYPNV
jgi:hypothetical protein